MVNTEVLWHSPESNFTVSAEVIIMCDEFEHDTSLVRSYGIHLMVISQEMLKISILDISLKIIDLRLQTHFQGANELMNAIFFCFLCG